MIFLKKGLNNINHIKKRKRYSLEFMVALKEKKYFKFFKIVKNKSNNYYYLRQNNRTKVVNTTGYTTLSLALREDFKNEGIIFNEDYYESFRDVFDCELNSVNKDVLNQFRKDLNSFSEVVFEKTINVCGDDFLFTYFRNIDRSSNHFLLNDKMTIEHNNEEVGFMDVVYSRSDILDSIIKNKDLLRVNYNRYSNIFLEDKDSVDHYKNMLPKDEKTRGIAKDLEDKIKANNLHLKNAVTEYSEIEQDYQGLGLGKLMYFYTAQSLNKEGRNLRRSRSLSEDSESLWKSMEVKFKDKINKIEYLGEESLILVVDEMDCF